MLYPYGNSGRQRVKIAKQSVAIFVAPSCDELIITRIVVTVMMTMSRFIVLSLRHSYCDSSLGSCDKCKLGANRLGGFQPLDHANGLLGYRINSGGSMGWPLRKLCPL